MLKQSNTTFFNSQNSKKKISKNTKILKQQEFKKKSKRKLLKRAKTQARLG